jgi:hypothetical protein
VRSEAKGRRARCIPEALWLLPHLDPVCRQGGRVQEAIGILVCFCLHCSWICGSFVQPYKCCGSNLVVMLALGCI